MTVKDERSAGEEQRAYTHQMGFCTASRFVKLVMQYQYMAPVIKATWIVSRILFTRAVMSADALGSEKETHQSPATCTKVAPYVGTVSRDGAREDSPRP